MDGYIKYFGNGGKNMTFVTDNEKVYDKYNEICVILPQMNGYIKYFDNGGKNMTFVTDNKKVYDKYSEIWEVIRKLLKVKFTVNPV